MALPVLALAVLYLSFRHERLSQAPTGQVAAAGQAGNLSVGYWLLASLVAVGIGAEFCVVYFGAELLAKSGLPTAQAATAMAVFYAGILLGQ